MDVASFNVFLRVGYVFLKLKFDLNRSGYSSGDPGVSKLVGRPVLFGVRASITVYEKPLGR